MDEKLFDFLHDRLPPAEMAAMHRRLACDPEFQREVGRLRDLLDIMREESGLAASLGNDGEGEGELASPPGLAERTIAGAGRLHPLHTPADWSFSTTTLRLLDFSVACGILLILSLLFIPGVATMRDHHARSLCANQLRSIGVAMGLYSSQEGNHLPYVATVGPLNNAGSFAWALRMRELLVDPYALICPGSNSAVVRIPTMDDLTDVAADSETWIAYRRWMSGSYGYSLGYWEEGAFQHGSALARLTQPIVSDRPPRAEDGSLLGNSPNHRGMGQNVLYADGHVRWLGDRQVAGDDLFCNRDAAIGAGIGPRDVVIGVSESTPTFFRSL